MIDFQIAAETSIARNAIRDFIAAELLPLESAVERRGYLTDVEIAHIRRQSRALGFWAMGVPQRFGGAGLDTATLCLLNEEIGRVSDALARRAFGAIPAALLHADEAQRDRYLLPAVAGDIHVSTAMSEPSSGSDAGAIKTRARASAEGWVLTGSKHFISDADYADAFIVTARDDSGDISCFLVDKDCIGLRLGRCQEMMGLRGVAHHELYFDGCCLPSTALLGGAGKGLAIVLGAKNRDRLISVGARSIGLAQHILEMSLEYARDRVQFGRPIAEFQLIQKMLSEIQIDIYAARMMMLNAAWQVDSGHDCREHVSAVKIFASEMLGRTTDKAIQIFGGSGYSKEYALERYYRDARVARIYEGTSEIHHLMIARSLLKYGVFNSCRESL